jgi:hypothetical protein
VYLTYEFQHKEQIYLSGTHKGHVPLTYSSYMHMLKGDKIRNKLRGFFEQLVKMGKINSIKLSAECTYELGVGKYGYKTKT